MNPYEYFNKLRKKRYTINHLPQVKLAGKEVEGFTLTDKLNIKDGKVRKQLTKEMIKNSIEEAKRKHFGRRRNSKKIQQKNGKAKEA